VLPPLREGQPGCAVVRCWQDVHALFQTVPYGVSVRRVHLL